MLRRNKPNDLLPQFADGTTIIAAGTTVWGDMESINSLRIDGSVNGNIKGTSKIIVGKQGTITGNIIASEVTILGKVVGDVEALHSVILKGEANIVGDLFTKMLTIEPEAYFNGRCHMDGNPKLKPETEHVINGHKRPELVG